jgi:carbamoyltransferase
MKILGIHFGHNAAAALVVEGKIVAAIEEEKLARIKGYIGMPYKAINFILKEGGIGIACRGMPGI